MQFRLLPPSKKFHFLLEVDYRQFYFFDGNPGIHAFYWVLPAYFKGKSETIILWILDRGEESSLFGCPFTGKMILVSACLFRKYAA
jgi:hypothetical protein